jgi:DNA-binding transcriptional regulator LsrR (DeoR family)
VQYGTQMSETATRAHAARLFYLRGLSKQQIAGRLGVSRFKVARMLEQAREDGLVRIEVRDEVPVDDALGLRLEQAFGLEPAVVVRSGDDLASAGGAWVRALVPTGAVVGTAWGSTLRAVVDAVPPAAPTGAEVVQLGGALAGLAAGDGPAEVAWRLAERLGGRAHPLPAPAVTAGGLARDELLANVAVRPGLRLLSRLDVALVGIGSLAGDGRSSLLRSRSIPAAELRTLRRAGAVGDLVVHAFDAQGRFVESELAARAVAASVAQLRRCRVLAVAGGRDKGHAVLGALRTGVIDVLVTDSVTARAVLRAA